MDQDKEREDLFNEWGREGLDLRYGDRVREEGRGSDREKEPEIEIGRELVGYWLMCLMVSYCSCRSEAYSKTLLSPLVQEDGVWGEKVNWSNKSGSFEISKSSLSWDDHEINNDSPKI